MRFDAYGRYQAEDVSGELASDAPVEAVCPFAEGNPDEDILARERFGDSLTSHPRIGGYFATYAGYVAEGEYRARGSSGGLGTWLLAEMLEQGLVDAAVHVRGREASPGEPRLFEYGIATTPSEVRAGAKSRYYPVEMSQALKLVRERPGRYVVIGAPCFIKAVRLLARQDPLLAERVAYCISLFCGHLKSARYADMLAWQCGIRPGELRGVDFRRKTPGIRADQYALSFTGLADGRLVTEERSARQLYGTDWGLGFFKYKACDFCDDVVGETADASVGDAWLPQYVQDSAGTNALIVRHAALHAMIERAAHEGRLHIEAIPADDVARSQSAGLYHRREALAYRLHLMAEAGKWRPFKRVQPQAMGLSSREQRKHALRLAIAEESHRAFQHAREAGDFRVFQEAMKPIVRRYRAVAQPLWKRLALRLRALLRGRMPR